MLPWMQFTNITETSSNEGDIFNKILDYTTKGERKLPSVINNDISLCHNKFKTAFLQKMEKIKQT